MKRVVGCLMMVCVSAQAEVRASVAPLADSEDPFVARRAEEFMATQKDSI